MTDSLKPFVSFEGFGFLKKMFIWSVLMEPMLYFIFYYGTVFLISGNLSKMLQTFFFLFLFFRYWVYFLSNQRYEINLNILNSPIYFFLILYLIYSLVSTLVGISFNMYSLELTFDQVNDFPRGSFGSGVVSKILGSYFIFLYYILFFVFFTATFLNSNEVISYFFRLFKLLFLFTIVTGYLDYFLFATTGIDLIARHFFDGVGVGQRFHGFAGEPRQAAVYLVFSLAVLQLESIYFKTKFNNWYYFLIIPAFFLTVSVTAVLMLAIFISFATIYFLRDFFSVRTLVFLIIVCLAIFAGYISTIYIGRFSDYLEAFDDLFFLLDSGAELPLLIRVQIGEIAPIFEMFTMLRDGNVMPVIFGSGMGSIPVTLYGFMGNMDGWGNPNAQIVRILFETGLLGALLYTLAFIYPLKTLTKNFSISDKRIILLSTMLLLSANFALRSPTLMIYFGLLIAVCTQINSRINSEQLNKNE
jgi:hypothetical protein|tara:strand:- start:15329 stop:16744 length:1416 start_codon:yes stop_codon:yes gene_type:complete